MKGTYRNLKKKIAFLMALSMTSSYAELTTFAEEFSNQTTGTPSDDNSDSALKLEVPENTATGIGAVEISFASVLTKAVNVEFTLSNKTGVIQKQKAENVLIDKTKVRFEDVPAGKYILTATSDKFAEYTQEITIENNVLLSLSITAGVVKVGGNAIKAGENTENGTGSIGIMRIGDVDGDEDIDDEDKKLLINNIESHPENTETDLNGDGITNLADLELFVDSYECGIITSSVEKCVIIGKNDVSIPGSYFTADSVMPDAMLRGEGELKIEPENPNEPISEENPVAIAFKVDDSQKIEGMTLGTGAGSEIEEGYIDVTYTDENGEEKTIPVPVKKDTHYLLKESEVKAEIDKNGNIQLNLGTQVAVKKVKITVTSMANKGNIAAISEVKFLNDMESRIPEPDVEIPEGLTADAGSEKFSLKWNPCVNIMGYEVKVEYGEKTEVYFTDKNSYEVSRFNDDDLKNYKTYKVSVQSVNGAWSSGYSAPIKVTPQANKRPDKPDSVKAVEDYKKLFISWKEPKDAQTYSVYYKERNSEDEYEVISNIVSTSCIIEKLKTLVEYEIYVKAHNVIGTSDESLHVVAAPIDKSFAEMPRYRLINRDEKGMPGSTHIIETRRYRGEMINSNVDEKDNNTTAWATVDGYGDTYYRTTTDDGGWCGPGNNGLTYTFDKEYTFNKIGVLTTTSGIEFTKFRWWDSNGVAHNIGSGYSYFSTRKTDSKGRPYYILTLPEAITTSKIQICLSDYWGSCTDVSEVYFYEYDELMDEIMGLYVDDLHTVLKDNVNQKTIDDLRTRINTPDKFGEINPELESLERELATAEKILNAQALSKPVEIHNGITTNDTGRGFSGLNAWQPLGVTLEVGQEVTVYVGCNGKKTGEDTDLRLISTQYHSESDGVSPEGANLKVGANTFKLTKSNLGSQENGGALYIQYAGKADANLKYSVRVTGGTEIPKLDLYKITDEATRKEKAVEFVKKLDEYVPTIQELHNQRHQNSENKKIRFEYDETNCILGASDIMLDTMMISLPAKQILAGTGKGTVEERAETLLKSLDAMEDMMYLFYQHKGLNASATDALNQIPKGHLNIRYQRMFSGAFMYASGNHIGIEWGSSPAIAGCESVVTDENGKYVSGNYFGWGIAHEIGHCINQGTYAVAEITNNYFAQLAQAKDENEGMRFQYENIYKKVTSGTKGNCSNIATQLGMYWQLHLAYDSGMNFKTYSDYNEQLANLFYARVDTYSRNTKAAPKPGGIELNLNGNSDQNLMRLACAAANKNVLEFFEHWGKTPNEDTIKYAEQFEKETRAIYFANDDSRLYAFKGSGSTLGTECKVNAIKDVSVDNSGTSNKVDIAITTTDIAEEDILGYEIERCIITGGDVEATPVGFSQDGTFTDTISTMNNRTVFYRVTLIDQYLNRSATFETKQVKIEHDGSMDKTNWTISVKGFEKPKEKIHAEEDSYDCHPVLPTPEAEAIDFDLETVYTPHITDEKAEITISFNQVLTTTGLKYTAGDGQAIGAYEIYVYEENDWTLVSEGEFNGSKAVYFANSDGKYVTTYDTTDVKLVITGQQNQDISIAEIDVLGVTGDNVDFRTTEDDTTKVIGFIGDDYYYDSTDESEYIPKGSLMFTGSYKGNPAYNMVMLYDNKGNVVGGIDENGAVKAQQIILADVPNGSNITEVTNGTWIYWIEPDELERLGELPEKVRVELYRVSDAKTNNGYRLVSDSLYETLPENLPTIMLTSENNKPQTTTSTTETTETTTTTTATADTENTGTTTTTTTTTAFIEESSEAE